MSAFEPGTLVPLAAQLGAGVCIGLGAIGAAVGEGLAAGEAGSGIARQPAVSDDLVRTMLVGQAVAESASVFALVVAILLLFTVTPEPSYGAAMALASAGLCMGLGALGPGIGAGFPAQAACAAIARNPHHRGPITTTMLVGQAVAQTPSIFALLVAFLLLFRAPGGSSLVHLAAILSAAISTGVGAIGPGIGAGLTAAAACHGVARRPLDYQPLLRTMLVGQAVSQSTSVYALLVSLILLFII